ncbi:C40 family peptidase [Mucilaginibacter jinjuensis]|uniref:NlpC/P60 family protein n=1 Tax=Mucilaginibacter jinjuensis TaxID=1176721 RepID=A0ABY7T9C6_9SPHI|nr:NlpC/P60 family protein [Mucilaginibacter jinjuensis]WCT12501.1 NlpC/P60 family protein [Mucilaginibacter jinjuensis]
MKLNCWLYILVIGILSCNDPDNASATADTNTSIDSIHHQTSQPATTISTGKTQPAELISFAESLIGTPYQYGSSNPQQGLDCSGFVTYVFTHFGITVPRSSVDFTNVQREIDIADAKPGDLILFTGTDSTIRTVGHMGIIVSNINNDIAFIHSTSGKAYGVTETTLKPHYLGRYVKTIRIFPQNDR